MSRLQTWKKTLKLDDKKSLLTEDDRTTLITDYLEVLSTNKCYVTQQKRKKCSCLSLLQGDASCKTAVASYIFVWASLDKLPQQIMLIEQIKLVNRFCLSPGASSYRNMTPFLIPFYSDDVTVKEKLQPITICKHAFAALHNIGFTSWSRLKHHAETNTLPVHGNVGMISERDKKYRELVLPFLKDYFTKEVIPLAGARPTRFTRDTVLKRIEVRDVADIMELDPGNSKRRLYRMYASLNGWKIVTTSKGSILRSERVDDGWHGEKKDICCWSSFQNFWKKEYPNLVIRRPSEDICGLCYQFCMHRRSGAVNNDDDDDNDNDDDDDDDDDYEPDDDDDDDDYDDDYDDEDEDEVDNEEEVTRNGEKYTDVTADEANILSFAKDARYLKHHIRKAISMRKLVKALVEEAKKCTADQVDARDLCITLIVDYCQNMDMPSFRRDQPGVTFFYVPMNIFCLGIVDCNPPKDILHAYMYDEGQGDKGGNNVASLIMKFLKDNGLLDGIKRKKLSIVMDNCGGQNKNNFVIRLAPYLVAMGYFEIVQFVFLIAGHTKNSADRLFNNLKIDYRQENIFCMSELVKACNNNEHVISHHVNFEVFFDWDAFLSTFLTRLAAVKIYQIFKSSEAIGPGRIQCRESDLADAIPFDDFLKKKKMLQSVRIAAMKCPPKKLYNKKPGLREIKQVGLYENYGPVIDPKYHAETCPRPPLEVFVRVKNLRPIGTKISKMFGGERFDGEIISIDVEDKIYRVKYDDGDQEEMSGLQISKYLHKDNTKKRTNDSNDKTKKSRKK